MVFKRSAVLLAVLAFAVVGCSSDPESAPTTGTSASAPVNTPDPSAAPTNNLAPTDLTVQTGSVGTDEPGTETEAAPTGTIPAITPSFDPPANPGGLSNEDVAFICAEPKTVYGDVDRKLSEKGADITADDLQTLSDNLGGIDVKKVQALSTLWNNFHSTIADYKAATQTSSPKKADYAEKVKTSNAALLEFFATNCPNPR